MSLYSIALFLHVLGALLLSAVLALEWVGLARLRRAGLAEQVREWGGVWLLLSRLAPLAAVTLLISGIYMAAVAWGHNPWWVALGLAGMVLLAALGARSVRSLAGIARGAATHSGPLSSEVRSQLAATHWWASLRVRVAVFLGVVFLMTVKPGLLGSLGAMGLALALGLVWGRLAAGRSLEQSRVVSSV